MLCLIRKMYDHELEMIAEVERTLDYIYRQLGQLGIIRDLPDCGVSETALQNRALDVKSTVMIYIAVHLSHECNALGTIGIFAL
jgi:hypothetical protein